MLLTFDVDAAVAPEENLTFRALLNRLLILMNLRVCELSHFSFSNMCRKLLCVFIVFTFVSEFNDNQIAIKCSFCFVSVY